MVVRSGQREIIVRDPDARGGQAVVHRTRIMVSIVLESLADGMTEDEVIAEHPALTVEGIRTAAAYGAELIRLPYSNDKGAPWSSGT